MRQSIPPNIRKQAKAKFDGHCAYCGCKPDKLQIDHLVPVIRGGTNEISNLMPSCFSCNNYKLSFDLEYFRQELQQQVNKARQYSVNFRLAERFGLIQIVDKPIKFYFEMVK